MVDTGTGIEPPCRCELQLETYLSVPWMADGLARGDRL